MQCPSGLPHFGEERADQRLVLVRGEAILRMVLCVCVFPFIINQTPAAGGDHCHGPQRAALSGLWAIPSTESGPQPLLVTYNLSALTLTPGEPTPYVCMYVSMVCGMYVGMYWVWRESTQVHREGGTVSSKGTVMKNVVSAIMMVLCVGCLFLRSVSQFPPDYM